MSESHFSADIEDPGLTAIVQDGTSYFTADMIPEEDQITPEEEALHSQQEDTLELNQPSEDSLVASKFSRLDGTAQEGARPFQTEALPENPEITRAQAEFQNTQAIFSETAKREESRNYTEYTNVRKQTTALDIKGDRSLTVLENKWIEDWTMNFSLNGPLNVTNAVVKKTGGGSHAKYQIQGPDSSNNTVDVLRRYSEFYLLRKTLIRRWQGFYIPPIPQKKAMGNKEKNFIKERWYYLNRFI